MLVATLIAGAPAGGPTSTGSLGRLEVVELARVVRVVALQPGVGGRRLGDPQALAQRGAGLLAEDDLAHLLQPDARDEVVRALLVVGVLAVVLQERRRDPQRLGARLDGREDVGLAHVAARGAAGAHLPAALDGDAADVLDRRLGAVARAAR